MSPETLWYEVIQLVLMLLACVACYFRGINTGIEQALEFCIQEELVDEQTLNRKIRKINNS